MAYRNSGMLFGSDITIELHIAHCEDATELAEEAARLARVGLEERGVLVVHETGRSSGTTCLACDGHRAEFADC